MVMTMARPTKLSGSPNHSARKVVPADVRAALGGRSEFRKVLEGATAADRRAHHRTLMDDWEGQIAAARAQLAGRLRRLTHRDVLAVAGEWFRSEVAHHEAEPGDPDNWDVYRSLLADRVGDHEHDEDPSPFEPNHDELAEAARLLTERHIAADADSIRRLAVALWETKFDLARLMERRAAGDYRPDDTAEHFPPLVAAPVAAPAAPPVPFGPLLDAWQAERQPSPNTVRSYRKTLRLIREAIGADDARAVTQEAVGAFKAARLAAGLNAGTVADDILAARSVFGWAVRNGKLPSNPFADMAPRPTGRGDAPRDGYDDDDARRILEAARKETGWRRWLPWLLCFTGMRLNEAADMRRRDIRKEGDVWIADIRPTAERAGKNASFRRMLPLHPALIAEGFLEHVASLPADGPLFPDIHADSTGARTPAATAAHRRWLRGTVGITDPRKAPAHSWRHRMEDELRKVAAIPEAADAITGHENPRNAGSGYGRGYRRMPAETLKVIERIPSPLPDLPPGG